MQLSIEEYLEECWKNKQEVIDVSAYKLNEEELNKVIFGIHYENPEYYWVLRNTAINKDEETGFVKTYYQYYEGTTGKPLDRSEELEREWEVVKEKTKYCKTDIEKALVVHEHLCDTIVYSSRLQAAAHDIEGAIFEKEAVCEGYALAYKYYMNRLEIPCKIVSGTSNGQSHAWNQIQLNGNWYMVDPTWDDVANSHDVKHQIFLCSENKFPNHVWNKESELYETCSDTTYDNLDWKNDLQGMYAYQGGLYRSKSLIVGGKEVSGIWRIDAENIEKEAELVLPITDQWQLNSVNVVRGYSQLSIMTECFTTIRRGLYGDGISILNQNLRKYLNWIRVFRAKYGMQRLQTGRFIRDRRYEKRETEGASMCLTKIYRKAKASDRSNQTGYRQL